jgi:hypothetical protein
VLQVVATGVLLGLPAVAHGQRLAWDGSVGRSGNSWRLAAAALWEVRLGSRIRLAAGPRVTRFGGDARRYRTHDEPPAGLASRIALAPEVWALNLAVSGEVSLVGPLAAGANLDLAGVAAGASRRAGAERLGPARWSLFLYGDRDRGSLNSEYYVTVAPGRSFRLRAGVSHYVTGYRVAGGSRARYLRFDTVPFLALRWVP